MPSGLHLNYNFPCSSLSECLVTDGFRAERPHLKLQEREAYLDCLSPSSWQGCSPRAPGRPARWGADWGPGWRGTAPRAAAAAEWRASSLGLSQYLSRQSWAPGQDWCPPRHQGHRVHASPGSALQAHGATVVNWGPLGTSAAPVSYLGHKARQGPCTPCTVAHSSPMLDLRDPPQGLGGSQMARRTL